MNIDITFQYFKLRVAKLHQVFDKYFLTKLDKHETPVFSHSEPELVHFLSGQQGKGNVGECLK